ncbi:hypothetical protein EV210_101191 [Anaerospora hongkongensis]|uniref:Uncharacterized protein n=1 Tax=Anaerospora hongkongensis TaxID=244830 RepID=A0A4R1QC10_9FIRM|nr:hypothetical protein [Anaerospora hongkongensis]TCL39991.1 hypothetical protein EV210_101191 [Anaerospora hongkongensis]
MDQINLNLLNQIPIGIGPQEEAEIYKEKHRILQALMVKLIEKYGEQLISMSMWDAIANEPSKIIIAEQYEDHYQFEMYYRFKLLPKNKQGYYIADSKMERG